MYSRKIDTHNLTSGEVTVSKSFLVFLNELSTSYCRGSMYVSKSDRPPHQEMEMGIISPEVIGLGQQEMRPLLSSNGGQVPATVHSYGS